jgi:outer membrane autotransporter protein
LLRFGMLSSSVLRPAAVSARIDRGATPSIGLLASRCRVLLAGTALGSSLIVSFVDVPSAWAACDVNTAGVSVCSGTDAAITKTATGNLDVQFNNETVTAGGVSISGGAGAFNVDLNVTSATGPNPISNTSGGDGVNISSNGGNVAVTTIPGASVSSTNGAGINSSVTGGSGNTAITFNADVHGGAGGVRAISSSTGSMSVSGSGNVSVGGPGVAALFLQNTAAATSGDLTVNTTGNFVNFLRVETTSAANNANIFVTHTGTITAIGPAIVAISAGGGNVTVAASNTLQGTSGILASTVSGGIGVTAGPITTTGGDGIQAQVSGGSSGGIAVTANGAIQASGGVGISSSVTGGSGNTAITFNADVSGGTGGVRAISSSTGSMSASGSGNLSVGGPGVAALLLQNTAAATSGDLTVNTTGNFLNFIRVETTSAANNADIFVTHTGTITAVGPAIDATSAGGGNVTVVSSNTLNGSGGIFASTATGGISVTAGPITATSTDGISAQVTAGGSRDIALTANGAITANAASAINAQIAGGGTGNIIVNVNAPVQGGPAAVNLVGGTTKTVTNISTITANVSGIAADGFLTLSNSGSVTGGSFGISGPASATINNASTGNITGTGNAGIDAGAVNVTNLGLISGLIGIRASLGASSVFNVGTITGTGGTAVQFFVPGNVFTLGPGFAVNGNVLGVGTDTFQLGGSGTASFDASLIGPAAQYRGFGTFNKIGDSTWTLSGTNALVLPWTVQQGTLSVTGTLANSPFTVQAGTLSVAGTIGAATVNGGLFSVVAGGTAGPVTMNAGTTSVDGTVGSVTMNGGVLNGIGTLGGLTVNGGVVAPGHSIGTLNVAGNVSFGPGPIYQVETNLAGQSDKIAAAGAATLTGGTVQALAQAGAYPNSITYTILTANGGRTGTFAGVSSDQPFLIASLSYDANDVFLTLSRNTTFFQGQAATPNQIAVAGALDTFPTTNALFLDLAALNGNPALRAAFDALSGEVHPTVGGVLTDESRYMRQALLGRLRQTAYGTEGVMGALGVGGPMLAYATPEPAKLPAGVMAADFPVKARPPAAAYGGPTWWTQALGAVGHADSDGNAAGVRRQIGGVLTGVDMPIANNWRAGLAGGYTQSQISVDDRLSVDTAHVGAYAGGILSAFNVRTGAAFAWHTVNSGRNVVFPGFTDHDTVRYNAWTGQAFGEIGYGMALASIALEPFAGVAGVFRRTDGFTETGGISALTAAASSENVGYSSLGIRAARTVAQPNGITLVPHVSAAWQFAFGDVTPTTAFSFIAAGSAFSIAGLPIARNSAVIDAGADVAFRPNLTLGIAYVGQFANGAQDNAVKGKATWAF